MIMAQLGSVPNVTFKLYTLTCPCSQIGELGVNELFEQALRLPETSPPLLTDRWQAPEVYAGDRHSTASVVWSLAVVLWEIATSCQQLPHSLATTQAEVERSIAGGAAAFEQPRSLDPRLWGLLVRAWSVRDRMRRPQAMEFCEVS
jgi:hypothetical protein